MAKQSISVFDELRLSVETNDLEVCKQIIRSTSASEITTILSKWFEAQFISSVRPTTLLHLAADNTVGSEIWEALLPLARPNVVYNESQSPLRRLIPYADRRLQSSKYSIHARREVVVHQLTKIRFWIETTKDLTTACMAYYRTHFLCMMCRVQGTDRPGYATEQDIMHLATDLIQKYNTKLTGPSVDPAMPPIHYATEVGSLSLTKLFLENGADPNALDDYGLCPLHLSYVSIPYPDYLALVRLLINHGANMSVEQENGFTALHGIMLSLQPDDFHTFMDRKDINQEFQMQLTNLFPPIHGMVIFSQLHCRGCLNTDNSCVHLQDNIISKLKVLQKHGIKLNDVDIHGRTVLHYACWMRYQDVVKFLLSEVANPYQRDSNGRGCLYYAITRPWNIHRQLHVADELAVIRLLENTLDKTKLHRPDKFGKMASDWLLFDKNVDCYNYLLSQRAIEAGLFEINTDVETVYVRSRQQTRGVQLVHSLLNDPHVGPLRLQSFLPPIVADMWLFIDKLATFLCQNDQRFKSTLELAGSMSEGTKVNPPDEFDFQFQMNTLSQFIGIQSLNENNDVEFYKKRCNVPTAIDIDDLFVPGQACNDALYKHFNTRVAKILKDDLIWKDLPFYWKYCCALGEYMEFLVAPLHLQWIGAGNLDIDVNVDLVPIIVLDDLSDAIEMLIPKPVVALVKRLNVKWHVVVRGHGSGKGRLSFLAVERWIIHRLMPEVREAYMLAKILRKKIDKTPDCDPDDITSYMLKNALFFELDPHLCYSLLSDELISTELHNPLQVRLLKRLRTTLEHHLCDRGNYIREWTWRIFNRLERLLVDDSTILMTVYCRPCAKISSIATISTSDGDFPMLKAVQTIKELLVNCDI